MGRASLAVCGAVWCGRAGQSCLAWVLWGLHIHSLQFHGDAVCEWVVLAMLVDGTSMSKLVWELVCLWIPMIGVGGEFDLGGGGLGCVYASK